MKLNWRKVHYKSPTNKNITVEHLRKSETQQRYKELVSKGIASISKGTNQDRWNSICKLCINSSERVKLETFRNKNKLSDQIETLSNHQKNLRLRIQVEKDPRNLQLLKNS